jgi:RNA polymerase sigma factor (sigma-70 family)
MTNNSLTLIVQHLRAAVRDGTGRTDGELLTHFLSRRDEDALATLVERHAPMVWGVCRRVLRNQHEAEDAFQATFLVLVQKAASVVPREMVANWLHGVAQQTAVRLRAKAAKRGWREVQMDVMPEPAVAEASDEELLSRLDEELSRLPERCRVLIVLCDLEGHTRKEVARQLGCPEGTVASGLARARELLAKRLTRRGLVVSGGSLAATLSHSMASADVPATVVTSTINVATLLAAGKAAGVISGPVATLTQGVLKTMFLKKILTTTMAGLALGVAVITGGSLAIGKTEGKPTVGKELKATVAEKPVAPAAKQEKANHEPEVAWGKEVDGLQLGLVLVSAGKSAYRPGETMELTVKVRNVSKEKITLRYGRPESTPTITDATGEKVRVAMPPFLGIYVPVTDKALRPGETVDLYNRKVAVEEVPEEGAEQKGYVRTPTIRVGTGTYKIAFSEFVNRDLMLSTGEIEFEVKDGDEKKQPEPKEAFTAWGQEVGGVQAGLGFKAGEKRVYHHHEAVTLVLRLRNVGKEEVKLSYYHDEFLGSPPAVTDDRGRRVSLVGLHRLGIPVRIDVTLAPGKTVDLTEAKLALRPVGDKGQKTPAWTLFGTGKYQLQCDKAGGSIRDPSAPEPVLSKLATGKLELEVKELEAANKEPSIAWGKELNGLQLGLALVPAAKTAYSPGETIEFGVYVRNLSNEKITITHGTAESNPKITDAKGESVYVAMPPGTLGGLIVQPEKTLQPRGMVELYKRQVAVKAGKEVRDGLSKLPDKSTIMVESGKFKITFTEAVNDVLNMPTGVVEFEVKDADKKSPEQKEALTAWGKEVGGLQAGLGLLPGVKRVYQLGDTVTLVVRVRNVGKEAVKFEYARQFLDENRPTVTNADGKSLPQSGTEMMGIHGPTEVSLEPGKEIVLETRMHGSAGSPYSLLPEGGGLSTTKAWPLFVGTGKFTLHYDAVFGNSSSGKIKLNPALAKLATGKLELEVKAESPVTNPPKDLGKIQPPGGVPLSLVKPGTTAIGVDQLNKVRQRLEAVPSEDLEKWMVELERIMDLKLKDGLPSARQVCRTDFAIRLSVAFDDLKWNAKAADNLYKRAQSLPTSEAKAWKQAFESLLKKEIGQTETTINPGGPSWAVPLVLIPVDALHEGQNYSVERGKKYRERLKQLTENDISLWKDKVDEFGGTKLDAAVNIILLDDYFDKERFRWESFKTAIETRKR